MSYSKLNKIVKKLSEKTEAEKIEWEPTALEGVFQTAFSDYTIRLGTSTVRGGVEIYIYNYAGELMESANCDALLSFDNNIYETMSKMYGAARRQALGVDKALDDILTALEEDDKPDGDVPI